MMDGGEPGRMPQQYDLNALQVPVFMSVDAWQAHLDFIGAHGIWRDVNPVITNMHRQIQTFLANRQRMSGELPQ